MSRPRDRALAFSCIVFGAMWLVAAGAKIAKASATFELLSRAVPPGLPPKPVIAVVIAAEAFLGTAMCLRAVRGLGWSLAGLALTSVALAYMRSQTGELFRCGCFGELLGTTIAGALLRNAVIAAIHVALIAVCRTKPAA